MATGGDNWSSLLLKDEDDPTSQFRNVELTSIPLGIGVQSSAYAEARESFLGDKIIDEILRRIRINPFIYTSMLNVPLSSDLKIGEGDWEMKGLLKIRRSPTTHVKEFREDYRRELFACLYIRELELSFARSTKIMGITATHNGTLIASEVKISMEMSVHGGRMVLEFLRTQSIGEISTLQGGSTEIWKKFMDWKKLPNMKKIKKSICAAVEYHVSKMINQVLLSCDFTELCASVKEE